MFLLTISCSTKFLNRQFSHYRSISNLSIAIVGAGPGGLYTGNKILSLFDKYNENLLEKDKAVKVKLDFFEKLPNPYGLVRLGVAPDHLDVKSVQNKFNQVLSHPNVQYFGNISIGPNTLPFNTLMTNYDVTVLSYGCDFDKTLNIPNESHNNVISAKAFVGWYNGDPHYKDLNPDLSGKRAIVLGQGNVALDVARILLKDKEILRKESDIADHALDQLKNSNINHVSVIGRRGPLQVSFTAKELREMLNLSNIEFDMDFKLLSEQISNNDNLLAKDRALKRLMSILQKYKADNSNDNKNSKWNLKFLSSPTKFIINENNKLIGLELEKNKLQGNDSVKAVGTGEKEIVECDVIFRSIGYKSIKLEKDIPFDEKRMVIPNVEGRVINEDKPTNFYVSGWLKTGPIGTIATTMMLSYETATTLVNDYFNNQIPVDSIKNGLNITDLKQIGLNPIQFNDWKAIDQYELDLGEKQSRVRVKICDIEEMIKVARN